MFIDAQERLRNREELFNTAATSRKGQGQTDSTGDVTERLISQKEDEVLSNTSSRLDDFIAIGMATIADLKSFKDIMSAVSIDLGLSQDDISNMKNSLSKVNKIQYKNPTAYVLGYLAANRGSNDDLNKNTVISVFKRFLPRVSDASVHEADIVRYARLWSNME